MQLDNLFAYASILVALTLAPGPLLAVAISRGLRKDAAGALAFVMGIAAGDVLIIMMIFSGLGMWLQSFPTLFTLAKYASLAYLLYIAHGMWCSPGQTEKISHTPQVPVALSDVLAGMVTCIVSPQTILIYLMLLPRLVDVTNASKPMIGFVAAFTFAVITLSFSVIVLFACRLGCYHDSSSHKLILNRTLSLVICLSGFWMVST
jgi:threonine/homoserine/homoserine lactone efflux protein